MYESTRTRPKLAQRFPRLSRKTSRKRSSTPTRRASSIVISPITTNNTPGVTRDSAYSRVARKVTRPNTPSIIYFVFHEANLARLPCRSDTGRTPDGLYPSSVRLCAHVYFFTCFLSALRLSHIALRSVQSTIQNNTANPHVLLISPDSSNRATASTQTRFSLSGFPP